MTRQSGKKGIIYLTYHTDRQRIEMTPTPCLARQTDDTPHDDRWSGDELCGVDIDLSPSNVDAPMLYVEGDAIELSSEPTSSERQLFKVLSDTWKRETAHLSRAEKIIANPSYRRIIDMGEPAVPLILQELEREPDYWFWALLDITHCDPISPNIYGDVKAMSRAWINWGKANGYFP